MHLIGLLNSHTLQKKIKVFQSKESWLFSFSFWKFMCSPSVGEYIFMSKAANRHLHLKESIWRSLLPRESDVYIYFSIYGCYQTKLFKTMSRGSPGFVRPKVCNVRYPKSSVQVYLSQPGMVCLTRAKEHFSPRNTCLLTEKVKYFLCASKNPPNIPHMLHYIRIIKTALRL